MSQYFYMEKLWEQLRTNKINYKHQNQDQKLLSINVILYVCMIKITHLLLKR